ncbi:MAG: MFS transporter [Phycisphaerales bacterium]
MSTSPTSGIPRSSGVTPLTPVFGVTILNSISTTILTTAIYFLTESAYHFDRTQNYVLGVVMGVTYILGSVAAGRVLRLTRGLKRPIGDRSVLAAIILGMTGACAIPYLFRGESSWPIWLHVCLYSPLSGMLWPIVESYLSGGREGERLRSALGRWNVGWSLAGACGAVFVSPLVKEHALLGILLFGAAHLASLGFLPWFTKMPGTHHADTPRAHPPVYKDLLTAFRIMLPVAYLVVNTLMPYLPSAMRRVGVMDGWQTALVAIYLFSRAATFLGLELWTGWHGKWRLAIAGASLIVGGFGVIVSAGWFGSGLGLAVLVSGLIAFGVGMSAIYVGAIYYAMEVSHSEVDAGGAHEALIGVGYTAGPLCGLVATVVATRALGDGGSIEPLLLAVVGLVAAATAGLVFKRVHHHTARSRGPG